MFRNTLLAGLGLLLLLTITHEPATHVTYDQNRTAEAQIVSAQPVATAVVITPAVLKPVEPPKPAPWAVTTSPAGVVPVEQINIALAHYQDMGMSKQGAAYLVGNFMGESHLIPCGNYGDGGLAQGLAQWHPSRRDDMPCDYKEQLTWAVDVEMQRDTPSLRTTLFDPNASVYQIQTELYKWERWGSLGARWTYAQAILNQI